MRPALLVLLAALIASAQPAARPRVLVSSDIGGTDPDDLQSMVHFLLYSDAFDVEGIVKSPYGGGRKQHILDVISLYERDYASLKSHSAAYASPDSLRAVAKQGAIDSAPFAGFSAPTEGSAWIVRCARRPDPRPLWVLVWGGIDDLAQALHDAPDIEPRLRVYFIGGPNKMWSVNAYNYIEQRHPKLWMIEANSTFRGWFVGGDQTGDLGNASFVQAHVAGHGALGGFFATLLNGVIKMGDSPSVAYLMRENPSDPTQAGWGGKFVRVGDGRKSTFTRLTTEADHVEAFGVVEFALPFHATKVVFDGRVPVEVFNDGKALRFRFSPRDAKVWSYRIEGDGREGRFTAVPAAATRPDPRHPNWWTDDPDPAAAEGIHAGARHVSRWRQEVLRDFEARLLRLPRR